MNGSPCVEAAAFGGADHSPSGGCAAGCTSYVAGEGTPAQVDPASPNGGNVFGYILFAPYLALLQVRRFIAWIKRKVKR